MKVYSSEHSLINRLLRLAWGIVYLFCFRPSPRPFRSWRTFLLRIFKAKIGTNTSVSPTCKIWAPWNLEMEDGSRMSDHVICYNVDKVILKKGAIVSQYSYLCTSGHDRSTQNLKLITAPITIGENAWVATDAFVSMGITVGANSTIGARASVFKSVAANVLVGGNPAKILKNY